MARVRKDTWANGMKGLFFGSLFGHASHFAGKRIYTKQKGLNETMKKFNKNTVFLSTMLGGALGSYVCSTATGKNNAHFLHDLLCFGSEKNTQTNEKDRKHVQ